MGRLPQKRTWNQPEGTRSVRTQWPGTVDDSGAKSCLDNQARGSFAAPGSAGRKTRQIFRGPYRNLGSLGNLMMRAPTIDQESGSSILGLHEQRRGPRVAMRRAFDNRLPLRLASAT